MKNMIRGLIHGNVRGWGTIQYQQYARLLGNRNKVGIELEVKGHTNTEAVHILIKNGFLFSRLQVSYLKTLDPIGQGMLFTDPDIEEYEIQYLFDVVDPTEFYCRTQQVYTTCKALNIPTYGSTHVNMQMPIDKVKGDYHSDIIGDKLKYVRIEYKSGPIWTSHKELIGGIITITSKRLDVAKYIDKLINPKLLTMEQLWEANFGNNPVRSGRITRRSRRR